MKPTDKQIEAAAEAIRKWLKDAGWTEMAGGWFPPKLANAALESALSDGAVGLKGHDPRPSDCRFRLQDEGKAYPKSKCMACGKGIATGLGKKCVITQEAGSEPERVYEPYPGAFDQIVGPDDTDPASQTGGEPVMWQWRDGRSTRHDPDFWVWSQWKEGRIPDFVEERPYRRYEERALYASPPAGRRDEWEPIQAAHEKWKAERSGIGMACFASGAEQERAFAKADADFAKAVDAIIRSLAKGGGDG